LSNIAVVKNNNMSEAGICSPFSEQLLMHKVFADLRNWPADFAKLGCQGDFAGLKIRRQWRSMPNIPSACRVDVVWVEDTIRRDQPMQTEKVLSYAEVIQSTEDVVLVQDSIRRDQPTQTETVLSYAEIIQNTEDVVLVQDSIRRDQPTQTNANKCKRPSFWKRIKRSFVRLFTR